MNTNTKYKFNMKGWFNESWRHILAAKGVKTKYQSGKTTLLDKQLKLIRAERRENNAAARADIKRREEAKVNVSLKEINDQDEFIANWATKTKPRKYQAIMDDLNKDYPNRSWDNIKVGDTVIFDGQRVTVNDMEGRNRFIITKRDGEKLTVFGDEIRSVASKYQAIKVGTMEQLRKDLLLSDLYGATSKIASGNKEVADAVDVVAEKIKNNELKSKQEVFSYLDKMSHEEEKKKKFQAKKGANLDWDEASQALFKKDWKDLTSNEKDKAWSHMEDRSPFGHRKNVKDSELGNVTEAELDYLRDTTGREPEDIPRHEAVEAIQERRSIHHKKKYQAEKKVWLGYVPKMDDFGSIIQDEFVDGKTKMGPWATMSPESYKQHGVGLGTGKGQRYKKSESGDFEKTEG